MQFAEGQSVSSPCKKTEFIIEKVFESKVFIVKTGGSGKCCDNGENEKLTNEKMRKNEKKRVYMRKREYII